MLKIIHVENYMFGILNGKVLITMGDKPENEIPLDVMIKFSRYVMQHEMELTDYLNKWNKEVKENEKYAVKDEIEKYFNLK